MHGQGLGCIVMHGFLDSMLPATVGSQIGSDLVPLVPCPLVQPAAANQQSQHEQQVSHLNRRLEAAEAQAELLQQQLSAAELAAASASTAANSAASSASSEVAAARSDAEAARKELSTAKADAEAEKTK